MTSLIIHSQFNLNDIRNLFCHRESTTKDYVIRELFANKREHRNVYKIYFFDIHICKIYYKYLCDIKTIYKNKLDIFIDKRKRTKWESVLTRFAKTGQIIYYSFYYETIINNNVLNSKDSVYCVLRVYQTTLEDPLTYEIISSNVDRAKGLLCKLAVYDLYNI